MTTSNKFTIRDLRRIYKALSPGVWSFGLRAYIRDVWNPQALTGKAGKIAAGKAQQ